MGKEHFSPDANASTDIKELKIPSDVGIYTHDIVTLKTDSTKIGIVSQVAGDVDSDSDITDDDDGEDDNDNDGQDEDEGNENNDGQDEDDTGGVIENDDRINSFGGRNDALPADQVRVVWMDHSETTHNVGDLSVLDRGFLHGDIVAAASDTTGQVGVVEDVTISVDLLAANGSIIKDVSSKYLKRVRDYIVGDYVVFGPWLGRVDDVLDNVTVLFDDGSTCKVIKADPMRLKPVSKSFLEDGHFPYYPGQRVRASSSSVFKNARWLSGLWKASRMDGTVTHVSVGSVFVYWIASAGYGPDCATTPAEEQIPKNLKLLSCFAHTSWQVGDWCFLPSQAALPDIPCKKSSCEINSAEYISRDQEKEHITEAVSLDHTSENSSSLQNLMAIDHDTTPNSDIHAGNVETNISLKSRSCSSSLSVSKESVHETRPVHRKKMRKVLVRRDKKARKKEKDENFERALLIVNNKTTVDVVWQDGRRELGMVSTSLVPIDNPSDQEFLAEQYVVEKAAEDEDDFCGVRRVGVVKSVNAKERTACVRWLKSVSRPEDPREFDKEEVVSVYELETHPDYDYCYGDVVVRLIPVSVSMHKESSRDLVDETNEQVESSHSPNEDVEETSNNNSHADFSDLSWVGNISGLKDGDIEVTWADGMVSTVGPQAIYVVGRDDDEESIGAESEMSDDDAASWETLNEDEPGAIENTEEEPQSQNPNNTINAEVTREDSEDSNSVRNGPLSIPLAALGFTTRLFTGFFTRSKEQIDPLISDYSSEYESQSPGTIDTLQRRRSNVESSSQDSTANDSYSAQPISENEKQDVLVSEGSTPKGKVLETLSRFGSDNADAHSMMQSYGNSSCNFKHFDTAKDPLDHFFLGANVQNNSGRRWLKKVQQDWSILQKNLPDSIYVRVYEDRMDLLRAVIVGAYGTPYQDGLFVFDFHLPPEYPQVPPSAHYHSGGWRINPNLYEEGKVCLSLLNTWTGRGNEVWDPSSSSILQVLVSLQGLVLNSKPYFNEAGYDKQVGTAEGEKNSLSYNENTFLLNCKSVMYLLRKPPKDFEELIKDHFQRRGKYILKACDAYMKGYLIGTLREDASLSDKSDGNSTSVGFKLMLAKILPKLLTSLSNVGADVEEFKHLCQS